MTEFGDTPEFRDGAEPEADKPGVVRALRVEIVDRDGTLRAVIGDLESPDDRQDVYGLAILDRQGRQRAVVQLPLEGPSVHLSLDGNIVAQLGINDPGGDALHVGAFLHLSDRDGRPVAGWRVEDDGTVTPYGGAGDEDDDIDRL